MYSLIRRTLLPVAAIALFAGCDDDPTPPDPEPEVATMRISIGAQTINVATTNCAVTGGPIAISANTVFTISWLLADGTPEPLVTSADFRADVTPANVGVVTFVRSGAFAGTLNRVAAGATTVNFALFHLGEGHNEFDCDVNITVT